LSAVSVISQDCDDVFWDYNKGFFESLAPKETTAQDTLVQAL
jgi:hypothetical protein